MGFDEWMLTIAPAHKPSDDGVTLRILRACWLAAEASERERMQRVVYARRVTPASQRDDDFNAGIDAAWAAVNRGLPFEA